MKNRLSVMAALCAVLVLVSASAQTIEAAKDALRLCYELILPGLFPFFLVSGFLAKCGFAARLGKKLSPLSRRLFGVSGEGATALLMGLAGGYPMGAAYLRELEKQRQISSRDCSRLLRFCNNSGPAFLVGVLGTSVFHSGRAGILLWLSHALAAVTVGCLHREQLPRAEAEEPEAHPPGNLSLLLTESVTDAVTGALNVCGFVVCFSTLTGLMESGGWLNALTALLPGQYGMNSRIARAILKGLFELGSGIGAMNGLQLQPPMMALGAGLVGWGGLSVHFQTAALFADSEVDLRPHTRGRLESALLGGFYAFLLARLFL